MTVQIIINGDTAAESLKELSVLAAGFGMDKASSVAPVVPTPIVTNAQYAPQGMVQQEAPLYQHPQYEQPIQQVPTQQAAPTQGIVPTAEAPAYSFEQLGVAAGPLVDAGRAAELTAWINQRGATSLSQLDKAHYGEFATYLRSLGAKI